MLKSHILSKRLQSIATMCGQGDLIADIGCDHCLIPIFLIKNNKYKYAIAADINENVLKITDSHIKANNLSKKIKAILSDGLKNIEKQPNCIVIAGMGGDIIANIIKKDIQKINLSQTLVLQPQTKIMNVRKILTTYNIYIEEECIIYDNSHYYIIIKAGKDDTMMKNMIKYYDFDTYIRLGILPIQEFTAKSQIFLNYLKLKRRKYTRILHSLENCTNVNEKRLKEIKEILKGFEL